MRDPRTRRTNRFSSVQSRVAVATLELVLALPVLLIMLVGLVWFGYSIVGQAEVSVQARQAAWQQRFEPWEQEPFDFNATQQTTQSASTTINVSPLLASESGPNATESLSSGPWDHRSIDYRPLVNWQLFVDMSMAAKTTDLKSGYDDARGAFQALESIGSGALNNALAQFANELTAPLEQVKSLSDDMQRRVELEAELAKSKMQSAVRDWEQKISQVERKLAELKNEEAEESQDQVWILEQRLQRMKLMLRQAKQRAE